MLAQTNNSITRTQPATLLRVDLSHIVELKQNEFIILPNPFDDYFNILKSDTFDVSFYVTDVSGKLIRDFREVNSTDLFIKVDMTGERAGMYFITLYYDDNFSTYKLVKK